MGEREVGQGREEYGQIVFAGHKGAVRGLPQESPSTRGSWRDQARKKANGEPLTFINWWCIAEPNPRPFSERDGKTSREGPSNGAFAFFGS